MFIQLSLNTFDNNIESIHISMSLDTNTMDISLISFST